MGGIIFVFYNISNRIAFYRQVSGKAEWRVSNGQRYLYVEADTHYDLGYNTGKALSYEIVKAKYLLIATGLVYGLSYLKMESMSKDYLDYIPNKYQREIEGMKDGATAGSGFSITFSDILIQTLFFEIIYGRFNPTSSAPFGCTDLGAKNNDNSIIIRQNVDIAKPFSLIHSFVLHKLNDDPLVFTYRLGGSLGFPTGKNEHGLNIVMNLVQTKIQAPLTTPIFVSVREGLANCKNVDDFYGILFPENESPYSLNFLLADDTDIIALQALPNNISLLYPATTIVQSNTYRDPLWQDNLVDKDYSKDRQEYAEDLIEEAYNDNHIKNKELLKILSDQPIICRNEEGIVGMKTIAFFTSESFGLGNSNGNIGSNPI